ncbi:hypothetical protein T02_1884 [Trichinella nativa]|uniref:Uncharacterized protein n=1 Tax=Trichinella nativa TaxID=6335 RepID=A0A0V1L8A2_9BILA|nr:hypothetical protein T02_1884 [Trichinella nativa]
MTDGRKWERGKMILLATKQLDAQAANPTTNSYALRREIKREKIEKSAKCTAPTSSVHSQRRPH